MKNDGYNNIAAKRLISPQTQTNSDTAIVSEIIDVGPYLTATFVLAYGGITDANATFTVLVEDGADTTTFTAVDDAYLLGTEAGAAPLFSNDDTVAKIGYIGPKQYVRITITPSGNNSGAFPVGGVAILGGHRKGADTVQLA